MELNIQGKTVQLTFPLNATALLSWKQAISLACSMHLMACLSMHRLPPSNPRTPCPAFFRLHEQMSWARGTLISLFGCFFEPHPAAAPKLPRGSPLTNLGWRRCIGGRSHRSTWDRGNWTAWWGLNLGFAFSFSFGWERWGGGNYWRILDPLHCLLLRLQFLESNDANVDLKLEVHGLFRTEGKHNA